jgi:hypothetical protein
MNSWSLELLFSYVLWGKAMLKVMTSPVYCHYVPSVRPFKHLMLLSLHGSVCCHSSWNLQQFTPGFCRSLWACFPTTVSFLHNNPPQSLVLLGPLSLCHVFSVKNKPKNIQCFYFENGHHKTSWTVWFWYCWKQKAPTHKHAYVYTYIYIYISPLY